MPTATTSDSAEALLAEVSAAAGLTDFGSDDFRPGLELLLETHRRTPLTDVGRLTKNAWLRRLLTNRLEIADVLRRDPTIAR